MADTVAVQCSAGACEMGEGNSLLAEKVGINVLYFEYF
jgi:hypothetical protein